MTRSRQSSRTLPVPSTNEKKLDNSSAEFLARILDTQFEGPGGFRFGLDGLLGLIPGVGDFITNSMAFAIVGEAALKGYPLSVLLRMIVNILIENVVDIVPLFGSLFDFFWKANIRNVQLMRRYQSQPQKMERRSKWFVAGFVLFLILLFVALTTLSILLVLWMIREIR